MIYIYGLFNDLTGEIFYVGKTQNVKTRLFNHKRNIAKDIDGNCSIKVLESGENLSSEDEYRWIHKMKDAGFKLLNKHIEKRFFFKDERTSYPFQKTINLPPVYIEKLKREKIKTGQAMSEVIRRALDYYFENKKMIPNSGQQKRLEGK